MCAPEPPVREKGKQDSATDVLPWCTHIWCNMEFWSWYSHSERLQIVPWDCTQYLERDLAESHPPSPLKAKEYVSPTDVTGRVEAFHQIRYSVAQHSRLTPADVLPWGLSCPSTLSHSKVLWLSLVQDVSRHLLLLTLSLEPQSWKPALGSVLKTHLCEGWERDTYLLNRSSGGCCSYSWSFQHFSIFERTQHFLGWFLILFIGKNISWVMIQFYSYTISIGVFISFICLSFSFIKFSLENTTGSPVNWKKNFKLDEQG